jgi:tetratricopeptide (TPR) repeat protein
MKKLAALLTLLLLTLAATALTSAQSAPKTAPASPPAEPRTAAGCMQALTQFYEQLRNEMTAGGKAVDAAVFRKKVNEFAASCLARLSVDTLPGDDLIPLVRLCAQAGQPDMARAAVTRRLAAKGMTPAQRADTMAAGVETAIMLPPISPESLRQAEDYAAQLDALGAAAVKQQIKAHARLGSYYRAIDVDEQILKHSERIPELCKKLTASEQREQEFLSAVASSYNNLAEVYAGRGDAERARATLQEALAQLPDEPRYRTMLEGTLNRYSLVGKQGAPIEAPYWLNAKPGTKQAEVRGQVTLLEFTAHWCGPCRKSYPSIVKLHQQFAKEGVQVMFITQLYGFVGAQRGLTAEQEVAADEKYFVEEHGAKFKIAVAQPPEAKPNTPPPPEKNFGNYFVYGIPQVVVLDSQGVIRRILIGWDDHYEAVLAKLLDELSHERGGNEQGRMKFSHRAERGVQIHA